jgi:GT2 family glycosyltransferase
MTEIIIVKYGLPEYERECVESVLANTNIPYHLTVYDNYPLDENLSVVWNRLIKASVSDNIILLNNDTIVEPKWAEKLILSLTEGVGAVGPITNKCGTSQSGFKKSDKEKVCIPNRDLSGFCLAFKKDVWEKVGGFDEEFKLYGEDSEFLNRVGKKYKLMMNMDVHIHHYGASSKKVAEARGKDIQAIRQESSQIYKRKR